jgi:Transposase DDE domain group 1
MPTSSRSPIYWICPDGRTGCESSSVGNILTPELSCRCSRLMTANRYQAFATNTRIGQLDLLEARHRAHARVEDRIRAAKDTGLGRLPSREWAINSAWVQLAAIATDLIAWLQLLALDGDLARAEPKLLRFRMLHVAARLTIRSPAERPVRFGLVSQAPRVYWDLRQPSIQNAAAHCRVDWSRAQ